MRFDASPEYARTLDERDDMAALREQYYLPPDAIYLDGNSLGLLSVPAEKAVLRVLYDWKVRAIDGWMAGEPPWLTLAEELGRHTAPLLGAADNEVVVTNSTTVNLHQLLATLYHPAGRRRRIVADDLAFPSDLYAIRSHLRLRGQDPLEALTLVHSADGHTHSEVRIAQALKPSVAVAVLPSVLYQSGQLLDMEELAERAHANGVLIGFDCSHSVGVVPHRLTDWGVDFAFWCGYKYLNGGPGATAGLYLNRRHFGSAPGLAGWFGSRKDRQFDMAPAMEPAEGAGALQIGSPNILSMAPLFGALELLDSVGIERVRRRSLALTQYLMALVDAELSGFGFALVTPREADRRGGHIALAHDEASRICKALRARGVVPDHRPPRIVRLCPSPLYTSFADCHEAVRRLRDVMATGAWREQALERELVP